jgi:aryl-alcohol dehydrogenase-like predicted oxidoreductase
MMTSDIGRRPLGANPLPLLPMAQGGSWYAQDAEDGSLLAALEAAYAAGIRHFDTAAGYGNGRSERLLGAFLHDKRETVFLASKAHGDDLSATASLAEVERSLGRLGVDFIDLYYIHWPRAGRDMRPVMEGLELARQRGKIGAVGVSNFSIAQIQQVAEVGRVDVHQLGYNLLWRYAEDNAIPFCQAHNIAVVAYSALGHGILTGKFGREPGLAPGDQRHSILPFRADIWPYVHPGVEKMKRLAADLELPLSTLAIRWILGRPGVHSVVVGARNRDQVAINVAALEPTIPAGVFAQLTAISDEIMAHVPDAGNVFNHYP